jgi:parvulin-like peptidyl-prolyl isomerase
MNRLLVLVALVALVAAACGSQRSALEVGDVSVSRGDLIDALEEQGQVTDGVASNAAAAQYLTDQARAVLLQGAADRAGLDVVVDLNNADQVFTTLVAAAVEERVPDIRAVAAASFTCSRHILVSTEAEAADLLTQLDGGADFAALAAEFSIDTGSGAAGGDLGCVPPGTFAPEFEAALLESAVNEVVGPVATDFGFHLIEKLPNDGASDQSIVQAGLETAFATQEEFDSWRKELLQVDDVSVDPRYGEWDPIGLLVVPPAVAAPE